MLSLSRLTQVTKPLVIILLLIALPAAGTSAALLAATAPSLGTAASFAVLGAETVTNTGPTVVTGDLGVSPGTEVTGFPPGIVVPPSTIHIADGVAETAQANATTAYNNLFGQDCDHDLTGQDLGGMTLEPGVYCFDTSAQLTGILTLNAQGDPDAVWVFQMGSTLTTASDSSVVFINSETNPGCNVFWQVGSSATLGTTTAFAGSILADQSITLNTGASLDGRALALNAAVTLDTNAVSVPLCESISGTVWDDQDGDGVKDDDEPGLDGWTVYVDYDGDGELGPGEPYAVTDADGTYTITGIAPGTWDVKQVTKEGWTQTYPSAPGYHRETFEGEALPGRDFGNWQPDADEVASISGTKWKDLDGDGVKDEGEPGLGGWVIYVDYNDNGELDLGEPYAVTAADGTYTITGVISGTFKVREVAQDGWECSFPTDSDDHGCYHEIEFASGEAVTVKDFGNELQEEAQATIGGMKWNDENHDGVKDDDEPGLEGWTVYVDYDGDGTHDAGEPYAVTDADGTYTITGIAPGTWYVREVVQTGWAQTYPSAPGAHLVTLELGDELTGKDFGNWEPAEPDTELASTSGVKWNDLDGDGEKDEGEPGLGGWVIYVDYNNNGVLDPGEPFAVTAADGTYTISGIKPGEWKVREVAQAGWNCSFPTDTDEHGCYHEETFSSGATLSNNDFGNWYRAIKSGMKFEDKNANGAKDSGEPGLGGWTIYVDYNDNGVLDPGEPSAVTAADGTYTISGIKPGTWKVREVAQAGWNCSFPTTRDGYGCYHEETFSSGATLTNNDFGNYKPVPVGGVTVPMNKVERLASWPGLAALAALTVLVTALTRMRRR